MAVNVEQSTLEDTDDIEYNRYYFDFGQCAPGTGYVQIDSVQDASWYGQWCNPDERRIIIYCEHDLTVIDCDTDEEFVGEMRKLQQQAVRHEWGATIDTGFDTALRQRFSELGLDDMCSEPGPAALAAATAGTGPVRLAEAAGEPAADIEIAPDSAAEPGADIGM